MTSGRLFGSAEVDIALMSGLHDRRWVETIEEIRHLNLDSDGRKRLDEAALTSAQILKDMFDEGSRLAGKLVASEIAAEVNAGDRIDGTIEIVVAPNDVDRAVPLLDSLGLQPQKELSPGAMRALLESSSALVMVPEVASPVTRLVLRWGEKQDRKGLLGLWNPSLTDLAAVRLPAYAWWTYWAIRPLRLARRSLSRRRESTGSAPYVATPMQLIIPLLEHLGISSKDVVADLGCGDGRILISAVTEFDCRGIGVESDKSLAALARQRVSEAGLSDKIEIQTGDAFSVDFSEVSVVFIFLPSGLATRLIPRVQQMLPNGARILAHEQNDVQWTVEPTRSQLVIHPAGITVAYIW